jgi:hypothetical protein
MKDGHVELNYYDPVIKQVSVPWRSTAVVATGTWHTFVAHVKWSAAPGVGFVELWYDGVQVVPTKLLATERCCAVQGSSVRPYPNYLKMGIYRDPDTVPTAVLYHGPLRIGTDRQMVEPSPGG